MNGHRRAALALYGLTSEDRAAILAELPDTDRSALAVHLAELRELGFDPLVLAELDQRAMPMPPVTPTAHAVPPQLGPLESIRAASGEQMLTVLEHEPAGLVRLLLSISPWPWAARFFSLCSPARRDQLRVAPGQQAAPAQQQFLLAAVAERLAALPEPAAVVLTRGRRKWPWTR